MKIIVKNYKNMLDIDISNYKIHIEKKIGDFKKFRTNNYHRLPFEYGEIVNLVNPSDNLFWDIIIVPSQSNNNKYIKENHNYKICGIIKEKRNNLNKENEDLFSGNHKLILSDKECSEDDKEIIEGFFKKIDHFQDPFWYEE
jgi:hypothetical protein